MTIIQFTLVKGHQVASGMINDPRFPKGTISAQRPFFADLGLQLDDYHLATINAQFMCSSLLINSFDFHFKQVKWHAQMPAEDFKFCRCSILAFGKSYPALIYQPQTATKTEHFQPQNQLELLAPMITNLSYGDTLALNIRSNMLTFIDG